MRLTYLPKHTYEDYIREAPILVAEIVSESSKEVDEIVKKELYREQGVKCYLLVYPEKREIRAYRNTRESFENTNSLSFELKNCIVELKAEELWR
ncbi:MAG: Uma2 family endonuclease [Acidobacteria bacterium]|jgi:Uma2 family endonuclease|nr:MAG: Uma2 family endonuclease [Acidobacteriota bacterium]